MPTRLIIRAARAADLPRLLQIERECFASHRFTAEQFRYYLRHRNSIFGIAESGGETIGYVAGIVDHRGGLKNGRVYSVAVSRSHARRGAGAALMKYFESRAAARDCASVTLEVYRRNEAALALYRARGYAPEAELPGYYGRGRHGLRMRKSLARGTPPARKGS